MRTLPIEYDVRGRPAAVLGADEVVASKIERLLAAGAEVTLYCWEQQPCAAVQRLLEEHEIRILPGMLAEAGWADYAVIFASTSVPAAELHAWARAHGRVFCAIDRPEHCTFVNPSALPVGGIGLRFFSGGVAPGLMKRLREDLQAALATPQMEAFVASLAALRARTPRAQRARIMGAAVAEFVVSASVRLPKWFVNGLAEPELEAVTPAS